MVLAGTILSNGTFLGMVKVYGKGSEAHLVVADDWSNADGYQQSPNGEAGNLFNASYNPPDGAQHNNVFLPPRSATTLSLSTR